MTTPGTGIEAVPAPEVNLKNGIIWSDEMTKLEDFASHNALPGLGLIVRGRYRGVGCAAAMASAAAAAASGTTSGIADSGKQVQHGTNGTCSNMVFVQSIHEAHKILMEAVKPHPGGRHVIATGRKFSLPLTYRGWFEVLSEDGRQCRPLSSVAELARLWPQECVVRESVRALVSGQLNNVPSSAATTRLERMRIVQHGEKLTLHDQVSVNVETTQGKTPSSIPSTRRYLRCVDEQGNTVFLNFEQKALVSPVAGPDNISGVHNIMTLLDKFRLPLTVRLVCGFIPPNVDKSFTSIFRLIGIYEDTTAFVLPLRSFPDEGQRKGPQKSVIGSKTDSSVIVADNGQSMIQAAGRMLSISTREPLVLVGARNAAELASRPDFVAVRQRCDAMVAGYANSIHVLVADRQPDSVALARGAERLRVIQSSMNSLDRGEFDDGVLGSTVDEEVEIIFDEVDDIYRYVREGGNPPPSRTALRQQIATSPQQEAVAEEAWVARSSLDFYDDKSTANHAVDDEVLYERIIDVSGTKASEAAAPNVATVRSTNNTPVNVLAEEHDENCWEEPIYADIEVIRERKRMSNFWNAGTRSDGHETGGMLQSSTVNSFPPVDSKSMPTVASRTPTQETDVDLIPVGNLRQLIKRYSMCDSKSSKLQPASTIVSNQGQLSPMFTGSQSPAQIDQKLCETAEGLPNDAQTATAVIEIPPQNAGVPPLPRIPSTTSSTASLVLQDGVSQQLSPTIDRDKLVRRQQADDTSTTSMTENESSRPLFILNRLSTTSHIEDRVDHQTFDPHLVEESGVFSSSTDEQTTPTVVSETARPIRDVGVNAPHTPVVHFPGTQSSFKISDATEYNRPTHSTGLSIPSSLSPSSQYNRLPSVSINNPPSDTVRGGPLRQAATTPLSGTTSVIVSRSGSRPMHQRHQILAVPAPEPSPVTAASFSPAPEQRYSRVAVSSGMPSVVLQNVSPAFNVNQNAAHQSHEIGQTMNVTRINTLGRRYNTQSNADRSQSAA